MRETGLGLKAATITPEKTGDVGSPNRILREGVGGSVIVRTGRRIPGVAPPAAVVHPIVIVRMAVGDAYGAEERRTGEAGTVAEQAWRTERIERSVCRSVAEFSFRTAAQMEACVYGGPKWTVSTVYEGMLKEEMDAAAFRYPDVVYRPTLIDAAYAGLITESSGGPLVVPALNRDGDCLSDLVLALFGSIAGAESVLLALDEEMHPVVAMAEAPHGTAPALQGKNVANPMAMLLACAAVLDHAAHGATRSWRAPRRPSGRRPSVRPPTVSAPSTSAARPRPPRSSTRSSVACRGAAYPDQEFGFGAPGDGASQPVVRAPNLARGLAPGRPLLLRALPWPRAASRLRRARPRPLLTVSLRQPGPPERSTATGSVCSSSWTSSGPGPARTARPVRTSWYAPRAHPGRAIDALPHTRGPTGNRPGPARP